MIRGGTTKNTKVGLPKVFFISRFCNIEQFITITINTKVSYHSVDYKENKEY